MRGVRPGAADASPSDEAARPIAAARRFVAHEGLIGHRLLPLPLTVGVAIVGNARTRAAAGAGQDEEASMPLDEVLKSAAFRHETGYRRTRNLAIGVQAPVQSSTILPQSPRRMVSK